MSYQHKHTLACFLTRYNIVRQVQTGVQRFVHVLYTVYGQVLAIKLANTANLFS